jgi:hypothetical protein
LRIHASVGESKTLDRSAVEETANTDSTEGSRGSTSPANHNGKARARSGTQRASELRRRTDMTTKDKEYSWRRVRYHGIAASTSSVRLKVHYVVDYRFHRYCRNKFMNAPFFAPLNTSRSHRRHFVLPPVASLTFQRILDNTMHAGSWGSELMLIGSHFLCSTVCAYCPCSIFKT